MDHYPSQLRQLRKTLSVDVGTLSDAIGVTPAQIYRIETGTSQLPLGKAVTLAKILKCSLDELCGAPNALPPMDEQSLDLLANLAFEDHMSPGEALRTAIYDAYYSTFRLQRRRAAAIEDGQLHRTVVTPHLYRPPD